MEWKNLMKNLIKIFTKFKLAETTFKFSDIYLIRVAIYFKIKAFTGQLLIILVLSEMNFCFQFKFVRIRLLITVNGC